MAIREALASKYVPKQWKFIECKIARYYSAKAELGFGERVLGVSSTFKRRENNNNGYPILV